MNLTGQRIAFIGTGQVESFKSFHKDGDPTFDPAYRIFRVTTAITTERIVTTQNRTAILLSW